MIDLIRTKAGSRLYGTYREDSDTDYRGVCIEPLDTLFGIGMFEQYEQESPCDVVIYGLKKFTRLALANNPNILDTLFAPREYWVLEHEYWKRIHDLRHRFLSKRVLTTYLGYAYSQVNKLQKTRLESTARYGYDVKHGAHLVRLLIQCRAILEQGEYTPVLTGQDLDIVSNVSHGYSSLKALEDMLYDYERELRAIALHTDLPDTPDNKTILRAVESIYMDYVRSLPL